MQEENRLSFPDKHKEIVSALSSGRFILYGEELYDDIQKNKKYYEDFFMQSFEIELIHENEIFYIVSSNSKEEKSKRIMLILSIYVYEISLSGKNIIDTLMSYNSVHNFVSTIRGSSNSKMCKSINLENVLQDCKRRNIVVFIDDENFIFTKAVDVFLNFAKKIAEIEE